MGTEDPAITAARRTAHRKALASLAIEKKVQYRLFLNEVHEEGMNLTFNAVITEARRRLRKRFPDRFKELYEEEKQKVGLPPGGLGLRGNEEIAERIFTLHRAGRTPKRISIELNVPYDFVYKKLVRKGLLVPKKRKKGNGKDEAQ